MKAGIHVVEASLHLNRVDILTVSCHMFSLCNEAAKEGEERDERGTERREKRERQRSFTCRTSLGCDLVVIDHQTQTNPVFQKERKTKHNDSCH